MKLSHNRKILTNFSERWSVRYANYLTLGTRLKTIEIIVLCDKFTTCGVDCEIEVYHLLESRGLYK